MCACVFVCVCFSCVNMFCLTWQQLNFLNFSWPFTQKKQFTVGFRLASWFFQHIQAILHFACLLQDCKTFITEYESEIGFSEHYHENRTKILNTRHILLARIFFCNFLWNFISFLHSLNYILLFGFLIFFSHSSRVWKMHTQMNNVTCIIIRRLHRSQL